MLQHTQSGALASDPPWLADQTPEATHLPDRGPWDMSSLVNGLHVGIAEKENSLPPGQKVPRWGHRAHLCPAGEGSPTPSVKP